MDPTAIFLPVQQHRDELHGVIAGGHFGTVEGEEEQRWGEGGGVGERSEEQRWGREGGWVRGVRSSAGGGRGGRGGERRGEEEGGEEQGRREEEGGQEEGGEEEGGEECVLRRVDLC
jgi:hypothetical protein